MKNEIATFALGCFWGPEDYFSKLPGVLKTTVGYAGGNKERPTYHDLGDHTETVVIEYDPTKISYSELLEKFFMLHDPTIQEIRQYRSVIFFHNEKQKSEAKSALKKYAKTKQSKIITTLEPAGKFWPAEEYHQKYFKKNNISGGC